ncbi:hypothetical protein HMPREF0971_03074, partial [Segatella oris F0302]
ISLTGKKQKEKTAELSRLQAHTMNNLFRTNLPDLIVKKQIESKKATD